MDKEAKDLIRKNIDKRVKADFKKFNDELTNLLTTYLPYGQHSSFGYSGEKYVTGEASGIVSKFSKELEPVFVKHITDKREKEFSDILTNLGSYLEMINH